MKASPDLYQLIRSLSKAEKRRFKLDSARGEGKSNNYLRLFDAIAAMESYDEAQLKQKFKGEKFIRNFSVAKAYLYDSILQSLRNAREAGTIEARLRRQVDHIEILHARGLKDQARKILRKAQNTANELHLFLFIAELQRWERRLLDTDKARHRDDILAEIDQREQRTQHHLQTETQLLSLRARIRSFFLARMDLRQEDVAQQLAQLMAAPLLQSPPDQLSFLGRQVWHRIHAIHHRMHGQTEAAFTQFELAWKQWEDHPRIKEENANAYLNAVVSYLDVSIRTNNFDNVLPTLEDLRNQTFRNDRMQARAFYLTHHLQLRYAITAGDLASAAEQEEAIELGLHQHRHYLSPSIVLTLRYNIVVVHFLMKNFPEAQRRAYQLLNANSPNLRKDIYEATRLFELIALYEREQFDLLESRRRSFERRLRNDPRQHPYEKLLLGTLRRLADARPEDENSIYKKMKDELEALQDVVHSTGREEMVLWLRNKLEGRQIPEMLREQAQSRA